MINYGRDFDNNRSKIIGTIHIILPFQLSLQLQSSSEYWSDKVRTMSLQLERAEAQQAMTGAGNDDGKSILTLKQPDAFLTNTIIRYYRGLVKSSPECAWTDGRTDSRVYRPTSSYARIQ